MRELNQHEIEQVSGAGIYQIGAGVLGRQFGGYLDRIYTIITGTASNFFQDEGKKIGNVLGETLENTMAKITQEIDKFEKIWKDLFGFLKI